MIGILGQKFEHNDLVQINHKNNYVLTGYIKDRDWIDKFFYLISLDVTNSAKRGSIGTKIKNIIEIKKLEV